MGCFERIPGGNPIGWCIQPAYSIPREEAPINTGISPGHYPQLHVPEIS